MLWMFNPVMLRKDTPYETEEGYLSLYRCEKNNTIRNIEVEYCDMDWKKQKMNQRILAQICQHEMDHLEGILI